MERLTMVYRYLILLGLLTLPLLACGGGGGNGTEPDPGPPATIVKVDGDAQIGEPGEAVPEMPTVEVRDASETRLSGIQVQFTASSGGSVTPSSAATDAAGRASVTWTLGPGEGSEQTLAATVNSLQATFTATACSGAQDLAVGEVHVSAPPASGSCGIVLPAGPGARYRVGLMWVNSSETTSTSDVTLSATRLGQPAAPEGRADGAERVAVAPSAVSPIGGWATHDLLRAAVERADVTERLHRRLRQAEAVELARQGGTLSLASSSSDPSAQTAPWRIAEPENRTFSEPMTSCQTVDQVPATLVLETNRIAVYQADDQASTDPVSESAVQQIADYYDLYGHQTIADYFGGTSDVDGNGKILVLILPFEGDFEQAAAFVLARDLQSKLDCAGSNEAEMTYFNVDVINSIEDGGYQALGTLVHEVKHISSLYNRIEYIKRNPGSSFHPTWIEEGTADIAGETSSRIAWAAVGGPSLGTAMTGFPSDPGIIPENYGVLLRIARVANTLSEHPNALTADPIGASTRHTFYGSSWHFHRFVGDVFFGGLDSDASFFREQNDDDTPPGVTFLQSATGRSFSELLEDLTVGVMANGAVESTPTFVSYVFPTGAEAFCNPNPLGVYPWPVTTTGNRVQGGCDSGGFDPSEEVYDLAAPFTTATYAGKIGAGGLRIHEFVSDGTGQGLSVNVDVSGSAAGNLRVVVLRLD